MGKSQNDLKSETFVVVHDLHYPLTNKPTFKAILQFLDENEVTGFIFGGDQFDNAEISHHNKNKPIFKERGSYKKNTEGFNRDILKPLEERLQGKTKVWITGNHERFEQDLIEEQPELEGLIDHVKLLNLEERGWEIVPLGHAYNLGKLNVIHGEILSGIGNQAGVFPSRKAVELYSASVLAGHTHSPQSFAKISPVSHTQKHVGYIAPCACDTNPQYLKNRPTAWLNGFTIVEVYNDKFFNVFPCITVNGRFAYGGRLYGK